MEKKYGKSYGDIEKIKRNFLEENEKLLKRHDAIGEIYRKQPLRTNCKLCGHSLNTGKEKSFVSHNIEYKICTSCTHVNGIYDDTIEFSDALYNAQDYGQTYYSEKDKQSYQSRMESIYYPKVLFLKQVLKNVGSILEIGAGSGFFCAAAHKEGYDIVGIEISQSQVEYANQINGKELLQCIPAEQITDTIRETDREILVAIGVLEHIYNLREVLEAIRDNKNIKYLYFSVPLFSFSVFFEAIFPDGFNRHLGGAHTHLFTLDSIKCMNKEFGFEPVGQWIFGTDVADLSRFIQQRLHKENGEIIDIFQNHFAKIIDRLQRTIDEAEFASEVHMIVKILHK